MRKYVWFSPQKSFTNLTVFSTTNFSDDLIVFLVPPIHCQCLIVPVISWSMYIDICIHTKNKNKTEETNQWYDFRCECSYSGYQKLLHLSKLWNFEKDSGLVYDEYDRWSLFLLSTLIKLWKDHTTYRALLIAVDMTAVWGFLVARSNPRQTKLATILSCTEKQLKFYYRMVQYGTIPNGQRFSPLLLRCHQKRRKIETKIETKIEGNVQLFVQHINFLYSVWYQVLVPYCTVPYETWTVVQ